MNRWSKPRFRHEPAVAPPNVRINGNKIVHLGQYRRTGWRDWWLHPSCSAASGLYPAERRDWTADPVSCQWCKSRLRRAGAPVDGNTAVPVAVTEHRLTEWLRAEESVLTPYDVPEFSLDAGRPDRNSVRSDWLHKYDEVIETLRQLVSGATPGDGDLAWLYRTAAAELQSLFAELSLVDPPAAA